MSEPQTYNGQPLQGAELTLANANERLLAAAAVARRHAEALEGQRQEAVRRAAAPYDKRIQEAWATYQRCIRGANEAAFAAVAMAQDRQRGGPHAATRWRHHG